MEIWNVQLPRGGLYWEEVTGILSADWSKLE